ncbi:lipocalin family protein [Pedobacter gandavensis]|uniref:lipocalin family protein n=1 Tax=Pedobacter gandavensis TaxID=2679963 RepID=UPI00247A5E37|nr:lipocalin family protein [Pedobacter gandavensis]WGQ10706.1 lipocalin family protein [Pedobacter gandavensis]
MKNKNLITTLLTTAAIAVLSSCASIPKNAKPVAGFNVKRYLGTWYEIARIDFRFEKDLDNTTAQYSLKENGNVKVLNSGYNYKTKKWKSANGIAKFRGDDHIAALKVSFFGPFYAGYNVIALGNNYQYALVAGKSLDYLWILSREKSIPEDVKNNYLKIARDLGYDTSRLIWVKQDQKNPYISE